MKKAILTMLLLCMLSMMLLSCTGNTPAATQQAPADTSTQAPAAGRPGRLHRA